MISQGNTEKNPNTLLMSQELKEAQHLMPISEADRDNLKKDIEKNGMRHPVIAYRKDGGYHILAGWNRREIAIELNMPLVAVQIIEGTPEEYKSFVITENLSRRHLTTEQKRELIQHLLKQDPSQSNRTIAKKTGTSKDTVNTLRGKLETGGEISHVKSVKGSDGKEYKKKSVSTTNQIKKNKISKETSTKDKTESEVLKNKNDIVTLIKDYLNNQIQIENEIFLEKNLAGKSTSKNIKIEARKDAFYEVLEFIKKLEKLK